MSPEDRERWILLFLPAALVLAAYGYIVHWRNASERTSLENQRTELQATAPSPLTLAAAAAGLKSLQGEVAQLEAEKEQLAKERAALIQGEATSGQRVATVGRVTTIVRRHGMRVVEQMPLGNASESTLPKSLADARKRMLPPRKQGDSEASLKPTAGPPVVWRLQLTGRYTAMAALLDELADQEPGALPVGLTMAEAATEHAERVWTLLLLL